MSAPLDEALDALRADVLDELRSHGALREAPVDEWARRDGAWNGRRLSMQTRIAYGDGRLSRVQWARARGEGGCVSTLTLVAVPAPGLAAPVLGLELIGFKGRLTFVALDLTPTAAALDEPDREALRAATASIASRGRLRDRSAPFSEDALLLTPAPEDQQAAAAAARAVAARFGAILGRATAAPAARTLEGQRAYFRDMAAHMKTVPAFTKLFGRGWVERYLDRAFFATEWMNIEEAA